MVFIGSVKVSDFIFEYLVRTNPDTKDTNIENGKIEYLLIKYGDFVLADYESGEWIIYPTSVLEYEALQKVLKEHN